MNRGSALFPNINSYNLNLDSKAEPVCLKIPLRPTKIQFLVYLLHICTYVNRLHRLFLAPSSWNTWPISHLSGLSSPRLFFICHLCSSYLCLHLLDCLACFGLAAMLLFSNVSLFSFDSFPVSILPVHLIHWTLPAALSPCLCPWFRFGKLETVLKHCWLNIGIYWQNLSSQPLNVQVLFPNLTYIRQSQLSFHAKSHSFSFAF